MMNPRLPGPKVHQGPPPRAFAQKKGTFPAARSRPRPTHGTTVLRAERIWVPTNQVGVSKNSGTPKWMVYNGKPYQNG